MTLQWRIYYHDGSTFSSEDGTVDEAPREGLICIVGYGRDGQRYIANRWDFYHWDEGTGQFWGRDVFGVLWDAKRFGWIFRMVPGQTTLFQLEKSGAAYDLIGTLEILKKTRGVFEGAMVSAGKWMEIYARAADDPDFPVQRGDAP